MTHQVDIKVNIMNGDNISISIPESSTILQLMNVIKEKTGIQENKQRLLYLGRFLEKGKTLDDYGIHSGVCIQLVQLPVDYSNRSRNEEEEVQTIRNSYVIYLPFRITETTTIPSRMNRFHIPSISHENSEMTVEGDGTSLSTVSPLQGAPPVPQYPPMSILSSELNSSFHTQQPLIHVIERLKEEIERIEEFNQIGFSSPVFHSFLHTIESTSISLNEYFHTSQNPEGGLDIENASFFYHALQTISTAFQLLLDRVEV